MALGEIGDDDEVGRAIEYSGGEGRLHTCYNFSLVGTTPRSAQKFRAAIEAFESRAGVAWPSWALSNHDTKRAVSRWSEGNFQADPRAAKLLPALLTSLRGTAFIYQGEELGLPETEVSFENIQDPYGRYLYPKWSGRDGCRTPMPWNDDSPDMGFSDKATKEPWLPVNENFRDLVVEKQEQDPASTLAFVRTFLNWRKGEAAMVRGPIKFFDTGSQHVLGFTRTDGDKTYTCLFNLTPDPVSVPLPSGAGNGPVFAWEGMTGKAVNDNIDLPAYGFFIS
jgi:alpha-glucosidase